jgi:redox-sensitive bicupin YhaK (pirin superfamily)
MFEQSTAKIFLAGERGHTENEWFRSYNTFNFGAYQSEHKKPFGPLYVVNDDTLAAGKSIELLIEEPSIILTLPVVGAVEFRGEAGHEFLVNSGQCQCYVGKAGTSVSFKNPYEEDLVNFLQIWIKTDKSNSTVLQLTDFDLDVQKNAIVLITPSLIKSTKSFLGMYDGRSEDSYRLSGEGSGVFVFVVQGAFEVQNRLLEARDGLALSGMEEVEFEALSNDAILLIIELPLASSNA